MKVESNGPPLPKGVDLHIVGDDETVAVFAAYVQGSVHSPGGDMKLTLGIPFAQVPNALGVMQYIGGVQFEVTVKRVPMEELPEPGW